MASKGDLMAAVAHFSALGAAAARDAAAGSEPTQAHHDAAFEAYVADTGTAREDAERFVFENALTLDNAFAIGWGLALLQRDRRAA